MSHVGLWISSLRRVPCYRLVHSLLHRLSVFPSLGIFSASFPLLPSFYPLCTEAIKLLVIPLQSSVTVKPPSSSQFAITGHPIEMSSQQQIRGRRIIVPLGSPPLIYSRNPNPGERSTRPHGEVHGTSRHPQGRNNGLSREDHGNSRDQRRRTPLASYSDSSESDTSGMQSSDYSYSSHQGGHNTRAFRGDHSNPRHQRRGNYSDPSSSDTASGTESSYHSNSHRQGDRNTGGFRWDYSNSRHQRRGNYSDPSSSDTSSGSESSYHRDFTHQGGRNTRGFREDHSNSRYQRRGNYSDPSSSDSDGGVPLSTSESQSIDSFSTESRSTDRQNRMHRQSNALPHRRPRY